MSRIDYEVIIVGAGPAGVAAAFDLRRHGIDVLLLDRHEFPRKKACGGGLTIKTLRALRYRVDPVIRSVQSCMRISFRCRRERTLESDAPICAMAVRSEFDEYCLTQALRAGAHFERIGRIDAIQECKGHVALHTNSGEIRSNFLVGADGADSRVRKLTGVCDPPVCALAVEGHVPMSPSDHAVMTFDFGVIDRGYGWVFPKADHANVGLYSLSRESRPTHEQLLEYASLRFPGRPVNKVAGHRIGLGGRRYRTLSKRVFLCGDAAGMADPLLGEGIYFAVKSGQAAAHAIERQLHTGEPAQSIFNRRLDPLRRDLCALYLMAQRFYRTPYLGYRVLCCPMVNRALIHGYARGFAFHEIQRAWWLLPLHRLLPGATTRGTKGIQRSFAGSPASDNPLLECPP